MLRKMQAVIEKIENDDSKNTELENEKTENKDIEEKKIKGVNC